MNREIKFRGKMVHSGAWAFGDINKNNQDSKVYMAAPSSEWMGGISTQLWDVDSATVGQFTGLRDKDGREIYEGDIVIAIIYYPDEDFVSEAKLVTETGTVVFDGGCFCIETEDKEYGGGVLSRYDSLEVIGNISEHKHLLHDPQNP